MLKCWPFSFPLSLFLWMSSFIVNMISDNLPLDTRKSKIRQSCVYWGLRDNIEWIRLGPGNGKRRTCVPTEQGSNSLTPVPGENGHWYHQSSWYFKKSYISSCVGCIWKLPIIKYWQLIVWFVKSHLHMQVIHCNIVCVDNFGNILNVH
jgi:hypothetical protein